jgi:tetratricopeptide (TPR) repeat protein
MSILSRLFRKPQPIEAHLDEALKEAFRLGEAVDNATRRKAVQLYADIIRRSPSARVAWFNMGVIQSRMGNWQEAIRSFAQAQEEPDLRLATAFARLKLLVEKGQQLSDADFPQDFRGDKRGALGVQGPCQNAANELRNRGYKCTLEAKGESCSIHCDTGTGQYIIAVNDLLGMLMKNVYRKDGDKEVNLGDTESLSETDREIKTLDIGRLPLVQAPVSMVVEASRYREARQIAERKAGPHGWVRMGRSFDEIGKQNAADAARAGMEYHQVTSLEHIAKSNWVAGSFLACVLDGEPHALAMLETVQDSSKPTLKRAVERSACVFRAEYFAMPEYPLVHIGLGLPVQFMEGSKVAFAVVENVANFLEANFQDWVSAIEMEEYTLVDVFAPDFTLVASGRTNLDAKVIAEIVESVNKANRHFNTIAEGSRDYSKAVKAFYQQHPEPFIWSPQAKPMR